MISFRKALFTLLAPLGAATIIGTGFATWVFGIQNVRVDASFNNNVAVTPEVEKGEIKILSCPSLLVFSEGTQGVSNLSDGIDFYTNKKEVAQGIGFEIKMTDVNPNHRLSLVYDNTTKPKKMYFSWKKDEKSNVITGELKKTTSSQIGDDDNYIGNWTGSVVSESQTLNVTLVLDANKNGILTFENNQVTKFTFEERINIPNPNITVSDGTFSFKYTYKNPELIDEKQTGYKLNVGIKYSLESTSYNFKLNEEKSNSILYYNGDKIEVQLGTYKQEGSGNFFIRFVSNEFNKKITIEERVILQKANINDPNTFAAGVYSNKDIEPSDDSQAKVPVELTLNDSLNATLKIGAMDEFISLVDDISAENNPLYVKNGENAGFLLLTNNISYAESVFNFDIDDSNLTNENDPYILYTCQLANFLRYKNSKMKPTNENKYTCLYNSSLVGKWCFKITLKAFFTAI